MNLARVFWPAVSLSVLAGCAAFQASQRPALDVHIERTAARVSRGEYLVKHVADCAGCHSVFSDEAKYAIDPDKFLAGGREFGRADGLPGEIYSTNLTSDSKTGLGNWTDGEILRAIREGVSKDGHALFPIMPYPAFRQMSDDDAYIIVAYLRTVPPVKNIVPERQLDFPLNFIVNTMPQPLDKPVPAPLADPVAHGQYLVAMASCADCHTQMNGGSKGPFMAGGMFMRVKGVGPTGTGIPSANITQDKVTGIGAWSDDDIFKAIKDGVRPDGKPIRAPMPWEAYAGMTDQDVRDIVAYLRTVPPAHNAVGGRW